MNYLNSFLQGYKISDIVPNAYDCTKAFTQLVTHYNYSSLYQVELNHTWQEKGFNWTQYISGPFADGFSNCTIAGYKLYDHTKNKNDRFPTMTDWLMAFVQNLLGNAITFQKLYDRIAVADKAGD